MVYKPVKGDENIHISTSLKEAYEPIMIYSSGVNNLMRGVGANPFGIKKMYKEKDIKPNYYYTLDMVNKTNIHPLDYYYSASGFVGFLVNFLAVGTSAKTGRDINSSISLLVFIVLSK